MCYFQPNCDGDIAVYFYKCQNECLQCEVPSREGLYEWDLIPIKNLKKQTKKNHNLGKKTQKTEITQLGGKKSEKRQPQLKVVIALKK